MATDVKAKIIAFSLPAYTDFNKQHLAGEPIPITHLKPFFREYSYFFRFNRCSRIAVREVLAEYNNIGANISHGAPDDLVAVHLLGWDMLTTMLIDIHLSPNIQPIVLMAMMASASNVKKLYLTTWTDATAPSLPPITESEEDVEEFCKKHGIRFVQSFKKLKSIDIDLVCEMDVSKVSGMLGQFMAETWMGKKFREDTFLVALLRRCLHRVRPKVTVSAAQESKTWSNDPFC
jgi:hypothetical protein